jgi:hypothetical protein
MKRYYPFELLRDHFSPQDAVNATQISKSKDALLHDPKVCKSLLEQVPKT